MRRRGVIGTAILVLALLGTGTAPALAAEVLAPEGPTSVEVRVIGPGHDVHWEMAARNISSGSVAPTFRVTEITGDLFSGPHPAMIELSDGGDVIFNGSASDLVGEAFDVGELTPGALASLSASVHLPAAAGDEYRTAAGIVNWEFVAFAPDAPAPTPPSAPEKPPRPGLPITGAPDLTALAAWVIIGGAFILILSRGIRRTDGNGDDS
ncbi:hypothetical protein PQI23_09825 [Leucobacter sp. USCH14]|uniref:hypothetical protein n=1 Tax=Leucobacter sp. USCH14 TaxID=3024838 RepID=UPI00309BA309